MSAPTPTNVASQEITYEDANLRVVRTVDSVGSDRTAILELNSSGGGSRTLVTMDLATAQSLSAMLTEALAQTMSVSAP